MPSSSMGFLRPFFAPEGRDRVREGPVWAILLLETT